MMKVKKIIFKTYMKKNKSICWKVIWGIFKLKGQSLRQSKKILYSTRSGI